jgi:hypothetical protein
VLGAALAGALMARRPASWRELIPLAVTAGALIQTLGVGAAGGWRLRCCASSVAGRGGARARRAQRREP